MNEQRLLDLIAYAALCQVFAAGETGGGYRAMYYAGEKPNEEYQRIEKLQRSEFMALKDRLWPKAP